MAAPKGHKRYGGRVKGIPNRKTLNLLEKCEEAGIDPFAELLKLCSHKEIFIRMNALKEVSQYLYPKRKAMEISVDPAMAEAAENVQQMSKEERIALLEAELKGLKDAK